ncbi:hypothetical protein LXA43DRAFT_1095508 [Ganoderma leucocontextum]|nr:hypothetical protein LXA43DRAFT_1095508 [Ganoderma leucocontextum]
MSSSFCPAPGVYAAIRMDPTAMVAHLDARALEEAQEIRPKTYLVLAAFDLSFPFPGRPWYGYNVWPVGPSLRAVDEKRCLEPDMCVPIFPNETHPAGRPPAHPDSAFPYDNCYHWAAMDLDVRVHAREEGFDNTRAVRMLARQRVQMSSVLGSDRGRARRARLAREQAVSVPPDHTSAPESSSPSTCEQPKDAATPVEVDIFAPLEDFQDPEYIPLFHLWLDLPSNLKQEDIGNPVDLYRERFAITSIIRRAHARNPELPTLKEYIALHEDPYIGGSDSESYMSSEYASEDDELEPSDDSVCKPKREQTCAVDALEYF